MCPVPFVFYGGTRGSGKTDALIGDWLLHSQRFGTNAIGILFRRTYNELEEVQRRCQAIFPAIGAYYRTAQRSWNFPNGSVLKLRYLNVDSDSTHYQGHSYSWMGFDELPNWPSPDPVLDLYATLRSAFGVPTRCVHTGNPGGRGHDWVKKMFVTPGPRVIPFYDKDTRQWRSFIPGRPEDNPKLHENDPGYKDRILAATAGRPLLRRAWLFGDWDVSVEGKVFQREWFIHYWTMDTLPHEMHETIMSCDLTFKKSPQADWVVMQVWGRFSNQRFLLDQVRAKMSFMESVHAIKALSAKWPKIKHRIVEGAANGEAMKSYFEQELKIELYVPRANKVERAHFSTAQYEMGNIWLPDPSMSGFGWVNDFVEEHMLFDGDAGGVDDQVDAESQAHIYFGSNPFSKPAFRALPRARGSFG
jgi:predicted phage terminase large subunit-like protein